MLRLRTMLLAGLITVAVSAQGQNTPATSTPQTKASAPAAVGSAATSAQAAGAAATTNSATYGSRRAAQSRGQGRTRRGAPQTAGQPQPAGEATPTTAADSVLKADESTGSSVSKDMQSAMLLGIPLLHNAYGIAKGTPIHVRLQQPVDSGHAMNGQVVRGVLTAPVGSAPAGAPVQLTVVAVSPAGQMTSRGELSVQVVSVNGEQVLSDVITAEGNEGTKLLPDGAPDRGTEAVLSPDQPLILPAG